MATHTNIRKARLTVEALENRRLCADLGSVAMMAPPVDNDDAEVVFCEIDTADQTSDSASPAFFKNCCAGAHYKTVVIDMRKSGGDPATAGKPFLQFKFDTVFTTKIDAAGPGDEGPEESITFVYGKLGVDYVPGDVDEASQKVR